MKLISKNKKAFFDYTIHDRFEAGLVLKGSEVKCLRLGHGSIVDSYAMVRDGEAYLVGSYIPALKHASYMNHNEKRDRKLLLKKKEIKRIEVASRQKGFTLVPLELYFNDDDMVKVEIAIAVGKAQHDKREADKKHDAQRDIQRALRR